MTTHCTPTTLYIIITLFTYFTILCRGQRIFVGGSFDTQGVSKVYGCAVWDTNYSYWDGLPDETSSFTGLVDRSMSNSSLGDQIYSSAYNPGTNTLTVVGNFTKIGGISAVNIAQYNFNTKTWSSLTSGSGFNGAIFAVIVDASTIFVGGEFTSVDGISGTSGVAQFDGSQWKTLGGGISGTVTCVSKIGDKFFVGGTNLSNGANSGPILSYSLSSTWSSMGSNLCGTANELTGAGPTLFAGGFFSDCSSNTTYILLEINSTTNQILDNIIANSFTSLPPSPSSGITFKIVNSPQVTTLGFSEKLNYLFIGGNFIGFSGIQGADKTVVLDLTSRNITVLPASPLGIMTDAKYINNVVYISGYFLDKQFSGITAWDHANAVWDTFLGGVTCTFCPNYDNELLTHVSEAHTICEVGSSVPPTIGTTTPTPISNLTIQNSSDQWAVWRDTYGVGDFAGRAQLYDPTADRSTFKRTTLDSPPLHTVNFQVWTIVVAAVLVGSFLLAIIITAFVKCADR